ncbi:ParE family toxin-like protein [Endozoicomonas gorgoniicola]
MILPIIWTNLPHSHRKRIVHLVNALNAGVPYLALGGKKIRSNDSLVRFHVGKNHRLLLKSESNKSEMTLLNRQSYEKRFKRRRNAMS